MKKMSKVLRALNSCDVSLLKIMKTLSTLPPSNQNNGICLHISLKILSLETGINHSLLL